MNSFAETYARLSRARKDDSSGAPLYSRFVNRPLGRVFAAAAFKLRMTPNQVTVVSGCCTFIGIGIIAVGRADLWTGVLVALFLIVGYALDSADGQLARLRGGGSALGEWLDHVIDAAKLASIHLAVLVTWYRNYSLPSTAWLLIPIGFSIVQVVGFFALILTDFTLRERHAIASPGQRFQPPPRAGRRHPLLFTLLRSPVDYGLSCLLFVFLAVPSVFITLYSLMAAAAAVFLALALRRYVGLLRTI